MSQSDIDLDINCLPEPAALEESPRTTAFEIDSETDLVRPVANLTARKKKIEMAIASAFSYAPNIEETTVSRKQILDSRCRHRQSIHHMYPQQIEEIPSSHSEEESSIVEAMKQQLSAYDSRVLDEYERNCDVNVVNYTDFTKSGTCYCKCKTFPRDIDVIFGNSRILASPKCKRWNNSRLNWLIDLEKHHEAKPFEIDSDSSLQIYPKETDSELEISSVQNASSAEQKRPYSKKAMQILDDQSIVSMEFCCLRCKKRAYEHLKTLGIF